MLKRIIEDKSSWLLILSNIVVGILAVIDHWKIHELFYTFAGQGFIICLFIVIRTLRKADPSSQNSGPDRYAGAVAFLFAYCFFNFVYSFFLGFPSREVLVSISIPLLIYLVNHSISYAMNTYPELEIRDKSDFDILLRSRILPLHAFVILMPFVQGAFFLVAMFLGFSSQISDSDINSIFVVTFMFIKTLLDVQSHLKAHNILRQNLRA